MKSGDFGQRRSHAETVVKGLHWRYGLPASGQEDGESGERRSGKQVAQGEEQIGVAEFEAQVEQFLGYGALAVEHEGRDFA